MVSQVVVVLAWLWESIHVPGFSTAFALLSAYLAVLVVFGLLAAIVDHVTRVVLTPSHLRVHRGLWEDDIQLGAIERVRVEAVSPWLPQVSLLGALLRRERDYMAFGVREALRVEWRTDRGRRKTTWVRFDAAPAFLARIEGLRLGSSGVRVAPEDAAEETHDDEDVGSAARGRQRG